MEYQSFFIVFKKYKEEKHKVVFVDKYIAQGFAHIKKVGDNYSLTGELLQSEQGKIEVFADNFYKKSIINGKNFSITLGSSINLKNIAIVCRANEIVATNADEMVVEKYLKKYQNITQKNKNDNVYSKIFGDVPITYFFDYIKPKLAKLFLLGTKIDFNNLWGEGEWTQIEFSGTKKIIGVIFDGNFPSVIAIGTEIADKSKISGHTCQFANSLFEMIFLSANNGNFLEFCDGIWR